ncbi:MAG: glycosyltransferase family 2 protein [Planctomycetaceae bacterium]|nr:glycosyltransferase family 2 protein [Planctomycetaceae bacterium]MCA9045283.1 glycosyltransferase family 2 protein [Planctomycetaceae bacterium]MCB9952423.1 glycosyltransferase family 2 protein [Planctomycetaceae bacterium]
MLSIVVPVFNEVESLEELHRQIQDVAEKNDIEYELVFVDDGSDDGSWRIIRKISKKNDNVSGIRFRRNFGKAAALTAGMRAAKGQLLMMMDADLQDDPEEIPRFLKKLEGGFDVVNGWKERRLDPWHKVYPSKVFNWMIGSLTGLHLHDHNCGIKLFRRVVHDEIQLYGELHRFIPVLAHARGFRVAEVAVHHRARQFGHSKYGVIRFLRGFLDLLTVKFLTSFGQRPQHMLGAMGLLFFGLGILGLGYLSLLWVCMNILGLFEASPIGGRPLLLYSVASLLLGAQGLSLGLLAELLVAYTGQERDAFSVAETTGDSQTEFEFVTAD